MSDINEKAPNPPSKGSATSVNYNNLGEVFTKISAWDNLDPHYTKPDQLNIDIESAVYSVVDGVSGWALKTILGYELNGEIVQDDTGNPEVINYADEICKRHKVWTIAKTHEPQRIRCFVKSVGQDTGGQPNVAAYPLGNEVSVNLTIPARDKNTVTFNANGGENAPSAQTKWHNETLILSSQKPTRTDYVFMGWSKTKKEPSGGNYAIDYAAGASFTENANTTLYAVWKPRPFVIKYDANGGTGAPEDQTKEHGQSIKLHTTVPTRQGYAFQGWATSKSSSTVAYQAGATYTADADVTLYAVWQIITYTITYNANGGTGAPNTQTKEYGKTVAISSTRPTKDGHVFQGWSTANDTTVEYQPEANYTANANVTLYAVWKIITYTISYDANGGSGAPQDQTKEWNKAINLSSEKPTRQGYTFQGWATSATGTPQYHPEATYNGNADLPLFAIWEIIVYTITYDANGGYDAPANQTKEYGKNVVLSAGKPLRDNYDFLGWSTTKEQQAVYNENIYIDNKNLNLYAIWQSRATKFMKTLNGYEICDESARNSIDNTNNRLDDLKQVVDEITPIVPVNKGGTGATTAFAALNNLGITWGTAEAPAKGTPNSIYIQIN